MTAYRNRDEYFADLQAKHEAYLERNPLARAAKPTEKERAELADADAAYNRATDAMNAAARRKLEAEHKALDIERREGERTAGVLLPISRSR